MKTFLNVIWYFPFFCFLLAIPTALIGLFFCLTVVGLPIGLGILQVAKFLLYPHTHALVSDKQVKSLKGKEQNGLWNIFSTIVSILWIPVGLILSIFLILAAIFNFCTILGIPNGLVLVKMLGAVFNPVNKVCVPDYVSRHLKEVRDQERLNKFMGQSAGQQSQNPASGTPYISQPQPEAPKRPQAREFTDERIEEVISNPALYNTSMVEQCKAEREIRVRSVEIMPVAESYSIEKLEEIIACPDEYSDELVYCAQCIIDRKREEEARLRAEQNAEAMRARQQEAERRKKEIIDFLKKWKYYIIGGVAALIIVIFLLWLFSDKHRFNVACEASDNGNYTEALEYAHLIDDPDSKFFDVATALVHRSFHRISSKSEDDIKKGEEITLRIEKTLSENPEEIDRHNFLARYYSHYLYQTAEDSTVKVVPESLTLANLASILENSADETILVTAGTAYYLSRLYDQAETVFENLAMENGNQQAYAYMAVMNLFNLCSNASRADGWLYLDNAPAEGMIALLKGDKALCESDNYKTRLSNAQELYDRASTPDIEEFKKALELRRHIVGECRENFATGGFSNNGFKYQGQEKYFSGVYQPYGWGCYKYDDGHQYRYGCFKFRNINNVQNVDATIDLRPATTGKGWESWITDYKSKGNNNGSPEVYMISYDGALHKGLEHSSELIPQTYYSFSPAYYMLNDPILNGNFLLTYKESEAARF